jgi:hypothetical protein
VKGRKTTDISVSTEISVDGSSGGESLVAPAKLKKDGDREVVALKLRDKGFSYRRIAETLQVPYILVSRWLNGDTAKPIVPQRSWQAEDAETERAARIEAGQDDEAGEAQIIQFQPRPQPPAPVESSEGSSLGVEVLEAQFKAFETYVRGLMTRLTQDHQEAVEREARLAALVETQKADAARLEKTLKAEIASLKATVDQLSKQGPVRTAPTETPRSVSRAPIPAAEEEDDPFAESAATPDDDPFADPPAAETDADPFADDPFADAGTAPEDDPFADPPAAKAEVDPFADDPFADAGATPEDDPFADPPATKAEVDPFADDPFADTGTTPEDDPFADPPAAKAAVDPFADDPFADTGTTPEDDPFADPPAAKAEADPFADDPFADTGAAPEEDPFADPPDEAKPAEKPNLLGKMAFWKK